MDVKTNKKPITVKYMSLLSITCAFLVVKNS